MTMVSPKCGVARITVDPGALTRQTRIDKTDKVPCTQLSLRDHIESNCHREDMCLESTRILVKNKVVLLSVLMKLWLSKRKPSLVIYSVCIS